jgi:hypothetical protein
MINIMVQSKGFRKKMKKENRVTCVVHVTVVFANLLFQELHRNSGQKKILWAAEENIYCVEVE